jgi:hypothetical protein
VITEAGNDPKVVGLVYVAAFAPGDGESVVSIGKPYPAAPLGAELRPDSQGFLSVTAKGIAEDFAQDLPKTEREVLTATQGPTNGAAFGGTVTTAAWKTKPSWFVIAGNDYVSLESPGYAFASDRSRRTYREGRDGCITTVAVRLS